MSARRQFLISKEVTRLQEVLGTRPYGHKERVDRPIAKAFLMAGFYFHNGRDCDPVANHVGLGVYDISIKQV